MLYQAEYERLKLKLRIDILRMDDELIQHPSILQDASECTADAGRVVDAGKHELDLITARVASAFRKKYAAEKVTEGRLNQLVIRNEKVAAATKALDDAKFDLVVWKALVDAFRAKGSSLKHLSELIQAQYIAPNSVRKAELREVKKQRSE